jgi:hypothetical protein
MTLRRGLAVLQDGSNVNATPQEVRLALAALIVSDGSSFLAARNGVVYDGNATNAVIGTTDTGTMTYSIRAAHYVLYPTGVASDGVAIITNDAAFKVSTTAAPGSNSRIDTVWVFQAKLTADAGSGVSNLPVFGVTQGTASASPVAPTLSAGQMALANFIVPSGTTSTNALTATQVHNWTTTDGSPIPVRNSTEEAALTPFDGMQLYRLDLSVGKRYSAGSGVWLPDRPYSGNLSIVPVANTPTSGSVSFPTGYFSANPFVLTNSNTAAPGTLVLGTGSSSATTTGVTLWVTRTNTTSTGVGYTAQQM